jgi:16S rRNA (adenine1518-N6/adenine1519-N6)-dimethyltransferase
MNTYRPRKRFGQHFLHDRNILDKIITAIDPQADQHFIEIGPGRGALTRLLIDAVDTLDVIEIDRDLAAALPNVITSPKLTIHEADALSFDFDRLRTDDGPLRLAGNLPYNISTPLLFHLLGYDNLFMDIHVMLQKEVAQRIAAEPGNRTYGRLSVAIAARCDIETLFHIRPGSFTPPPRVDSSFIRLRPDASKRARIMRQDTFDRVVKQAFGQRRKRLSNALGSLLTADQIESVGVDAGTRAEQLSVEQFIALGNLLAASQ